MTVLDFIAVSYFTFSFHTSSFCILHYSILRPMYCTLLHIILLYSTLLHFILLIPLYSNAPIILLINFTLLHSIFLHSILRHLLVYSILLLSVILLHSKLFYSVLLHFIVFNFISDFFAAASLTSSYRRLVPQDAVTRVLPLGPHLIDGSIACCCCCCDCSCG